MQKMNGDNNDSRELKYFRQRSQQLYKEITIGLEAILREEISNGKFPGIKQLAKTRPEAEITESEKEAIFNDPETRYLMSQFLLGKKWRPISGMEFYRGFRGSKPYEAQKAMIAVEAKHKESVIKDDVIDNDESRYGLPTVWYYYAKKEYDKKSPQISWKYKRKISNLEKKNLKKGDSYVFYKNQVKKEIEEEEKQELEKLWTYCKDEGQKKDADLFTEYISVLTRRITNEINHPKRQEIEGILEAAHDKLTQGERMEVDLRRQLQFQKKGLQDVTEDEYWKISDYKACLFDTANEIGFTLAMEDQNMWDHANRLTKPNYINDQLLLVREFSQKQDRLLQLTDNNLMYSTESGKSQHSDVKNAVPTLQFILLDQELRAKGNGDYKLFIKTFGNEKATTEDLNEVINMMKNYGIDERIERDYISKYIEESKTKLDFLDIKQESKDFFIGAIEAMRNRNK